MGVLAKNIGPAAGYDEFGRTVCLNDSGVNIVRGDICFISGASHLDDVDVLPKVTLADADATGGAYGRLKIAAEDVETGKTGVFVDYLIMHPSTIPPLAGSDLWLSTTPGKHSVSKPASGKGRKVGEVFVRGSSTSASQIFLNVLGWPDVEDDSTGALGVGESRVIQADIAYDDTSPLTLVTVPSGEIWVGEYTALDVTTGFDGTGADLDIGVTGGDTDGLLDGSADITDISATDNELANRQLLVDASASAQTVAAVITPGTTPSAGAATVYIKFTRVA